MASVAADLNEEIERLSADIQAMEAELSPRAPLPFRVRRDADHSPLSKPPLLVSL